jgi:hypothetical protein
VGYYLETPPHRFEKAAQIVAEYKGTIVDALEAALVVANEPDKAVICVVQNPEFEAAAFCYSMSEYERFTYKLDRRPRTWIVINDRALVEERTGYAKDMAAIGDED